MKRRVRGFSLVELLAVIAVIAVLASLAVSMVARARESAWQTACAAQLREIGTAVRFYAADHAGRMPDLRWDTQHRQISMLREYLRDQFAVFRCPATLHRDDLWPAWYTFACATVDGTEICTTYKMNDNQTAVAGRDASAFASAAWLVVALDTDWAVRPRHRDTDNVVFLDGHVQAKTRADLMGADPNGQSPWWWWGTQP